MGTREFSSFYLAVSAGRETDSFKGENRSVKVRRVFTVNRKRSRCKFEATRGPVYTTSLTNAEKGGGGGEGETGGWLNAENEANFFFLLFWKPMVGESSRFNSSIHSRNSFLLLRTRIPKTEFSDHGVSSMLTTLS